MRRFLAILAILAFVFSTFVSEAVAQGRRTTGDGQWGQFDVGERVVGAYLEYADGWFAEGPCYLPRAEAPGWVISGASGQLFPGEIAGKPICVFQPPAEQAAQPVEAAPAPVGPPAPQPRLTGKGLWGYFTAGEPVVGFNIQLQDFRQWRRCYFHNPPLNGWVLDGVVHPLPDQVAEIGKVCDPNNPDVPPPAQAAPAPPPPPPPVIVVPIPPPSDPRRQETGDGGTLRFGPGTPIVGAFIRLDDSRTFFQCNMVAPTSGQITSGVLFPRPDEMASRPACDFQRARIETGIGLTMRFEAGVAVSGAEIRLFNGSRFRNCFLEFAPTGGLVTSGVVWPTPDEVRFMNRC